MVLGQSSQVQAHSIQKNVYDELTKFFALLFSRYLGAFLNTYWITQLAMGLPEEARIVKASLSHFLWSLKYFTICSSVTCKTTDQGFSFSSLLCITALSLNGEDLFLLPNAIPLQEQEHVCLHTYTSPNRLLYCNRSTFTWSLHFFKSSSAPFTRGLQLPGKQWVSGLGSGSSVGLVIWLGGSTRTSLLLFLQPAATPPAPSVWWASATTQLCSVVFTFWLPAEGKSLLLSYRSVFTPSKAGTGVGVPPPATWLL